MLNQFFGKFASLDEVFSLFRVSEDDRKLVGEVLFANYTDIHYSGDASVVFVGKDRKLYEVHGSHCSCRGLEGQWKAEEVNPKDLLRDINRNAFGPENGKHVKSQLVRYFPMLFMA